MKSMEMRNKDLPDDGTSTAKPVGVPSFLSFADRVDVRYLLQKEVAKSAVMDDEPSADLSQATHSDVGGSSQWTPAEGPRSVSSQENV